VAVYAEPKYLVLFAGKNDLLDYRTKPEALSPEATNETLYHVPMPTTKPAGWIRFREAIPRNPDTKARLDIWNAEVSTIPVNRQTPELRTFVAKNRNLIVTEYQSVNGSEIYIELVRNKDSTGVISTSPEFGSEKRSIWVRYHFPPDPDTYPDGFEYAMFCRVIGGESVKAEVVNDGMARLHIKSFSPVILLSALFTTHDDKNPLQAAKAAVEAAGSAGMQKLRREHSQAWHDFWQRSFVQLDVFEKHTRSLVHENGLQTYPRYSGHGNKIFMHFLGWPVVVNESLVQSYTGQIRVTPVKLKNTARFARLRTTGAFLLSGEIQKGGKISYLAITSEAGCPCRLVRPWDSLVRVRRMDSMEGVAVAEKDGILEFSTVAGETYVVDRPDEQWEAQPVTIIG